jgi:hypothetical protein
VVLLRFHLLGTLQTVWSPTVRNRHSTATKALQLLLSESQWSRFYWHSFKLSNAFARDAKLSRGIASLGVFFSYFLYLFWEGKVLLCMKPTSLYREEFAKESGTMKIGLIFLLNPRLPHYTKLTLAFICEFVRTRGCIHAHARLDLGRPLGGQWTEHCSAARPCLPAGLKSGAMLLRESGPHYMFVYDLREGCPQNPKSVCRHTIVAKSDDLITWTPKGE